MEAVSYARVQVSLVHEWLTNRAGSEQCVAAMRRAWPGSSVSTTVLHRPEFPDWDPVHTSVLQPLARSTSSHIKLLPLLPAAWRTVEVPAADVVVTSFHTFSLRARLPPGVPNVAYCYTPPRFLWRTEQLADERLHGMGPLLRLARRLLGPADVRRAQRPDLFVGDSTVVRDRIRAVYGRDAEVVFPPVDVDRFRGALGTEVGEHHVVFGRLVPYKRVDLAVEAFRELGWPLVVAGDGRQRAELERTAPPNVRFVGRVPDDELPALLAGARGLVFPGEEDFGITPVEAMAAGAPVVAYGRGGARDTVVDGESGLVFDEQTPAALAAAVRRAAEVDWDRAAVSASVDRFREERFRAELHDLVASVV